MKNVEYFKLGNYFVMLHQRLRNSVFAVSGKLPLHKRNQGFILVKLIIFLKATQKVQESFEFMIEIKNVAYLTFCTSTLIGATWLYLLTKTVSCC